MKYKVRLNDSIDLIVDANSEVEAVRAAKNVKDAMRVADKGRRLNYDDDLVVVTHNGKEIYRGIEDYEPMNREPWKWNESKGVYELSGGYVKRVVDSATVKVHDSDQLRKLAYDLAQLGNYFDRANSAHSRSLLSANDKQKLTEFFNLGTKVYEVMKKEVEEMRKAKAAGTLKERRSWDWTDTQKLLYDGIERMYWTHDPKLEALSKRLSDLWDEYRKLIGG